MTHILPAKAFYSSTPFTYLSNFEGGLEDPERLPFCSLIYLKQEEYTFIMKNLLIAILAVVVLGGGYFLVSGKSKSAPMTKPATPTVAVATASPSTAVATEGAMKKNEVAVTLTASGFEPQTVTVKVGEKIVWTNKSGSTATVHSNPHPIHTDYKLLNLGKFEDGGTLEFTAVEKGTYHYHDHLHPNRMGTVIVE